MFTLYFNSILLVGVFTTGIVAIIVYSRQKKDITNRMWFLTSIFASLWSIFYFFTINAANKEIALFLIKIVNIIGLLIIFSWIYFVMIFLEIYKQPKFKKIFLVILLIGIGISILSFTSFFIKDMIPKYIFNYYVEPGIGYYIYTTYFFLIIVYGLYLLVKLRKNFLGVKETQIKYIIIASTMGFIGGCSVFLLALNIFFPPYPLFLFAAFPLAIAYAINKHHLFNIRVIATELFTLVIWVFLLIRLLLSESITDLIINVVLLIAVVIFGVLLIRSVTREVEQREQMEVMAKEVQKAYEVEKAAKEEVEKLTEAKTQFIMATQHHLRTPLTSIIGYLDLLFGGTYGKVPSKIKETLLKFQVSTKRLIRVVNALLDISQFQMGKRVVTLEPNIDFESLIKEVMEELSFEVKMRGLYLKYEKIGQVPAIKADSEKLKVALFNIIDNAIKYTKQGGITVNLKQAGKFVQLSVKDTGIGVDQKQAKKLFKEAFARGDEAKKVYGFGSGIGVYVTGHIIRAHNGRIWAESEGKGKGSTFYVELPVG